MQMLTLILHWFEWNRWCHQHFYLFTLHVLWPGDATIDLFNVHLYTFMRSSISFFLFFFSATKTETCGSYWRTNGSGKRDNGEWEYEACEKRAKKNAREEMKCDERCDTLLLHPVMQQCISIYCTPCSDCVFSSILFFESSSVSHGPWVFSFSFIFCWCCCSSIWWWIVG